MSDGAAEGAKAKQEDGPVLVSWLIPTGSPIFKRSEPESPKS